VFVIFVATRPAGFRVTRSTVIAAPPSVVFAQVNDLHNWEEWSPWAKLDPAAKRTYEGPPAGTGSIFRWAGNKRIGEGSLTVMESRPNELVGLKLEFLKPFACTNTSEFMFKPEGGQTTVTWSMSGKNNFMAKVFHFFVNFDKMIGGDFEKGLAQMKSVAEMVKAS
jgi:hypothetical protein